MIFYCSQVLFWLGRNILFIKGLFTRKSFFHSRFPIVWDCLFFFLWFRLIFSEFSIILANFLLPDPVSVRPKWNRSKSGSDTLEIFTPGAQLCTHLNQKDNSFLFDGKIFLLLVAHSYIWKQVVLVGKIRLIVGDHCFGK